MLKIPENLLPYVDFEEGNIIAVNLPNELEEAFDNLKKDYEAAKKDEFTDY